MNIFATLQKINAFTFRKVNYYSIQFEDNEDDISEFFDFLNRMEDIEEKRDDLLNFIQWLEDIGNIYGATEDYFRPERNAFALPPPRKKMEISEIPVIEYVRLYCLRLSVTVVVLFNGGIKTTQKAQDCPNVSKYFNQANRLAAAIDKLLMEGEICWNEDQTDLIFNSTLTIEI